MFSNVSRSPWLLGQMKTSLVRSWVLRRRKNDAVTLFSLTAASGPTPLASSQLAEALPELSAITVVAGLLKYVRGKFPLFSLAYIWMPWPIWRRLLAHFTRLACSRARLSDGSRMEISSAMMPITTSSSTRVKPFVLRVASFIKKLLSGNVASMKPDAGRRIGWMK